MKDVKEAPMARVRFLLTAALLALPALASAQTANRPPAERFRKWDLGGGLGIRFGETDDAVVPLGNWMAEGSRYWTPHFKTSLLVTTAGQTSSSGYQYDPPAFRSISSRTTTRPAAFGLTAGYQFFDNEFIHPYLSAGVRFASAHVTTTVQSSRSSYSSSTVDAPDRLQRRPIVGGGFKSYFANGRAFMRTELLVAIGPDGTPHTIFQFGSGVDF
jgi:Outer membrane protein beta-barrel domain